MPRIPLNPARSGPAAAALPLRNRKTAKRRRRTRATTAAAARWSSSTRRTTSRTSWCTPSLPLAASWACLRARTTTGPTRRAPTWLRCGPLNQASRPPPSLPGLTAHPPTMPRLTPGPRVPTACTAHFIPCTRATVHDRGRRALRHGPRLPEREDARGAPRKPDRRDAGPRHAHPVPGRHRRRRCVPARVHRPGRAPAAAGAGRAGAARGDCMRRGRQHAVAAPAVRFVSLPPRAGPMHPRTRRRAHSRPCFASLMLVWRVAGIGPRTVLEPLGIPVVADLPVGEVHCEENDGNGGGVRCQVCC